jgi:pilus assembly protein CpaE
MYPLKIILVGCDQSDVPSLRRAVAMQPAVLAQEFSDLDSLVGGLPGLHDARFVFVIQVDSPASLQNLRRLSRLVSGQPIVALMNQDSDSNALVHTLRAGACQVVKLPVQLPDWKAALETVLVQYGCQAAQSKVIALSGVSEGCGATTLALNLSYEVARGQGRDTVLAELAPRLGRLADYLDITPNLTLAECFKDHESLSADTVEHALTPLAEHLRVLTGPHQHIGRATPTPESVGTLLDILRQLGQVVILDIPCTFDDAYFAALTAADEVILIGEQSVPSLRAMKVVKEALASQQNRRSPRCLINRYVPGGVFSEEQIKKTLGVEGILTVSSDPAHFRAALNDARWLRDLAPRSAVVAELAQMSRLVLGVEARPLRSGTLGAWFRNLFGHAPRPVTQLGLQAAVN